MDSQFNISDFAKNIGRLEAVGEQMTRAGEKISEKVDDSLERLAKVETRLDENEKSSGRKMFLWSVAITVVVGAMITLAAAYLTIKFGK